jgi:uncharacterized protein YjdB
VKLLFFDFHNRFTFFCFFEFSQVNLYAAGSGGTILHYDGSAWSAMSGGVNKELSGIWGSGPNDVYAVGDSGTILHYGSAAAVPVTGVALDRSSLTLTAGASDTLTATVTPPDATDKSVTWSSSDNAVATVDAGGAVTAVSLGDTVITITTTDSGFTATCEVTVASQYSEWDVNNDGQVNMQDLIQIGQHLNESGAPGWIKHDVKKDGRVNVLDMILAAQRIIS